ncbi:MAG: hypothetical protein ABWZ83_13305 [Mesorhizobium sp.]
MKPETAKGYVIKNRGARKNGHFLVRRNIGYFASQYGRRNHSTYSITTFLYALFLQDWCVSLYISRTFVIFQAINISIQFARSISIGAVLESGMTIVEGACTAFPKVEIPAFKTRLRKLAQPPLGRCRAPSSFGPI